MAALQRYVVENGINVSRVLFANQDILATYCTKVQSVKGAELGICSLRTLQFQMLLMNVELLVFFHLSNKRLLNPY